jgi:hypothetical protein
VSVNFIKTLQPVLSQNIQSLMEIRGLTEDAVYDLIVKEADRNRAEWFSDSVPNLNYELAECRLAYLYIVAATNANTVKDVLLVQTLS